MFDPNKYQPSYTDISNWNKKPYSSTGGTRAKNIYTDENEIEYFFKGSKKLKDGTFKYPMEFWSEIVSSKIGSWLGFNILDYNIAFDEKDEQQIGCLSKSMVDYSENKLSEGVDFLRGYDSKYNPVKDESKYTFEFINRALDFFNLTKYEDDFIEMLIFDAIIGNSDRHQENWAFISKFRETIEKFDHEIGAKKNIIRKLEWKFKKFIAKITLFQRQIDQKNNEKPKKSTLINQSIFVDTEFSPIYDSGCCLGRELLDEKIEKMLLNEDLLEKFVKNGKSEVRFEVGKKPKHLDLLSDLNVDYPSAIKNTMKRVNTVFSSKDLTILIDNVDNMLPKELFKFKLPENRKKLMIKLIDLRITTINQLLE